MCHSYFEMNNLEKKFKLVFFTNNLFYDSYFITINFVYYEKTFLVQNKHCFNSKGVSEVKWFLERMSMIPGPSLGGICL